MDKIGSKYFILGALLFTLKALGSPVPGMGSSYGAQILKDVIVSEKGFRFGVIQNTFWKLDQEIQLKGPQVFRYQAIAPDSKAQFHISVDNLERSLTADAYIKRWIKEYPSFGFEVLKTQNIFQKGYQVMIIDFSHREKNKQLRQFVAIKNSQAVVMTCSDDIGEFQKTAPQCADLLNSFEWTSKL